MHKASILSRSILLAAAFLVGYLCIQDNGVEQQKAKTYMSSFRLLRERNRHLQEESGPSNENLVLLRGANANCFGSLIHADIVLTAGQCAAVLNIGDSA